MFNLSRRLRRIVVWVLTNWHSRRSSQEIPWQELEDKLFQFASREIRLFAREKSDETFYGFAFDCNSDYGQVGLCYNTPEHLANRQREQSKSATARSLKWALGDWKYPGVQSITFDSVLAAWVDEDEVDEDEEDDDQESPNTTAFMRVACRVLVRLEAAGVFESMSRTEDFQTFAKDHDESESAAWKRLAGLGWRVLF